MKRRSFVKSIGALAVVSQIGITKVISKKEDINYNLLLSSEYGILKMNLIEIELLPEWKEVNEIDSLTYLPGALYVEPSIIKCKAIVLEGDLIDIYMHGKTSLIYKPDKNTVFECQGFIIDWMADITPGPVEVEFTFKVSGAPIKNSMS